MSEALAIRRAKRFRDECRERHPRNTAKLVARDLDVKPDTAERYIRWTDPQPPCAETIHKAGLAWGAQVVARVLCPESQWSRAEELDAAIGRLERFVKDMRG